jgi:hypothetical protein
MATIWRLNEHLQAAPLRVAAGDELQYAGYVHGSVGNDLAYEILAGGENLRFLGENIAYHHPENMKEGWTGGDGATATFHFRALQAGEARLRLLHHFRGEIEEQYELLISIAEGE